MTNLELVQFCVISDCFFSYLYALLMLHPWFNLRNFIFHISQYHSDFDQLYEKQNYAEDHFLNAWRQFHPKLSGIIKNEISLLKYSENRDVLGFLSDKCDTLDEGKISVLL